MCRCAYDNPADKARSQIQESFVSIDDEPNGCVYPRRLSQSAIETLFGEICSYSRGTYRERMGVILMCRETAISKKTGKTSPSCGLKRRRALACEPENVSTFKI
jgi:hypothetical protein